MSDRYLPGYLAAGTIVLLVGMVFMRVLVFPNWVPLLYLFAGTWLFHRQVLREEEFMRRQYGDEYSAYCRQVRRYV